MADSFFDIAFTPTVRAMQSRMGSREAYARMSTRKSPSIELGHQELEFIAARDSFYQASSSETGWPYVQFRGGPVGFLKALDSRTLAYADFRGNKQYVSVGNMTDNSRVSLILMDYVNRRRLKLLGYAQIVESVDNPSLVQRLAATDYDAVVERAVVISIAALSWNCPQHITPRYSEKELENRGISEQANMAARLRDFFTS
jgi:uncharacterized protein